jgi:hypothetical protein
MKSVLISLAGAVAGFAATGAALHFSSQAPRPVTVVAATTEKPAPPPAPEHPLPLAKTIPELVTEYSSDQGKVRPLYLKEWRLPIATELRLLDALLAEVRSRNDGDAAKAITWLAARLTVADDYFALRALAGEVTDQEQGKHVFDLLNAIEPNDELQFAASVLARQSARDTAAGFAWLDELTARGMNPDEAKQGSVGGVSGKFCFEEIADRLTRAGPAVALVEFDRTDLKPERVERIRKNWRENLIRKDDEAPLAAAIRTTKLSPAGTVAAMEILIEMDAGLAAETLVTLHLPEEEQRVVQKKVFAAWKPDLDVNRWPWIYAHRGDLIDFDLPNIFSSWSRSFPFAASACAKEMPEGADRDTAILAIMTGWRANPDLPSIQPLLEKISDPALREKAMRETPVPSKR